MGLLRWSRRPAEDVEARHPAATVVRGVLARATTPLLPDDYLQFVHPLWSARELRGRIVDVRKETDDCATVVIRPGWGFPREYRPGQYVGIGLDVDGKWHWRSYSLTSLGDSPDRTISITVKANPDGFLSSHLVDVATPGTVIRLASSKGDFVLPEPPPEQVLFLTAGSGITPVMAMLRTMRTRGTLRDVVHVHSAPERGDVIFAEELDALARDEPGYRLHLQLTRSDGKVDLDELGRLVPDWTARECWTCGPSALLDDAERVWRGAGREKALHTERFTLARGDHGGEGGTVVFSRSGKSAEIDGATTLLEAGENLGITMPYGCRMGICQTCVVPLAEGYVRDLRSGDEHREGERIQTCISSVSGECTLDL
ncbi:ferredoxin reductase [Rhodococcus rhodnii]|uniref:Oxidoreductase n=2 Tax=Rhodococcus rhodnii TaxID=38312 RepID=R7WJN5_9NOCA|nr:ferredoxin reductase [Rhodococcus rhodnii]EOM75490.1 oxidoreductase [Rhodococcus rhodnii LMG 5362]TXG90493.1 ferredoxin reductase [Rhodococcus rhodnii]